MRVDRHAQRGKPSRYVAPKRLAEELINLRVQSNRAGIDFLKTDLAAALTFSKSARTTTDPARKQRNRRSARKAYDTIAKMARKVTLTDTEAAEIAQCMKRLKSELLELGENF